MIHHAGKMEEFELAFKDAILEVLGPREAGVWTLRQSRTGARSCALIAPDNTEYHIRSDNYEAPQVDVYDAYQQGTRVVTLRSPMEVRSWLQTIVATHRPVPVEAA